MKTNRIVRGLAAGLLITVGTLPIHAEEVQTREKTLSANDSVVIANIAGTIEVVPGRGNSIRVVAEVHAEGSSDSETRELIEGMQWVKGPRGHWGLSYPTDDYRAFAYPERWGSGYTSSKYFGEKIRVYRSSKRGVPILYADLKVEMPAGSDLTVDGIVGPMTTHGRLQGHLTLDTGSGRVEVESFDGELVVDTGSGDVEIADAYGTVSVDTGSGSVEISQLELSDLHVDTGSGDVWFANGHADRVLVDTGSGNVTGEGVRVVDFEADTGSGDVTLSGDLANARRLSFDTGSGDVRIEGGRSFEFDLDADLGSGRVVVDYSDAKLRYDGREVVGARRGSGGTRVSVDTGSGDCILN